MLGIRYFQKQDVRQGCKTWGVASILTYALWCFAGPLQMAVLEERSKSERWICAYLTFYVSCWSRSIQGDPPLSPLMTLDCVLAKLAAAQITRSHMLQCVSSFQSTSGRSSQSFWASMNAQGCSGKAQGQGAENRRVQEGLMKEVSSDVGYIWARCFEKEYRHVSFEMKVLFDIYFLVWGQNPSRYLALNKKIAFTFASRIDLGQLFPFSR